MAGLNIPVRDQTIQGRISGQTEILFALPPPSGSLISLPYTDASNILIDLFDRNVETKVPAHLLLTIRTAKNKELERFMSSDPLTKMYVFQVLREKANDHFNRGDADAALYLYSSVK